MWAMAWIALSRADCLLGKKQSARQKAIQAIAHIDQTAIFYESPKRILACAQDLQSILGDERIVCFAKELTKSFETIKTDTLPVLIDYLQADDAHQKGEFVILISAIDKNDKVLGEEQLDKILPILLTEMGASKAAKLAAKITGIDKKYCYQRTIGLWVFILNIFSFVTTFARTAKLVARNLALSRCIAMLKISAVMREC